MANLIEAFTLCLKENRKLSKNTLLSYGRDLKMFARHIGTEDEGALLKVKQVNIAEFIEGLKTQGKSNATISRYIVSLHRFYQYLMAEGRIASDPTVNLEAPKVERALPQTMSTKEVDRLLEQPQCGSLKGYRDKAMLELLYATGIKVSEMISLDVSDVDVKNATLICRGAGRERYIPMNKTALAALGFYTDKARSMMLSDKLDRALFVNCSGQRLTRQGFWKIIKAYAKKAGIKGEITPQTLRNSFATHLLQNGADISSVAEMLGHSDTHSTQVYEQVVKSKIKNVYQKAHPRA